MSQRSVERTLGRLVTDDAFRLRFAEDPQAALQELDERGEELNRYEQHALCSIDRDLLARLAEAVDPRPLKSDLRGERP